MLGFQPVFVVGITTIHTRYGNSEGEPSIWQPALYGRYVGLRVDAGVCGLGSPLARISEEGCGAWGAEQGRG